MPPPPAALPPPHAAWTAPLGDACRADPALRRRLLALAERLRHETDRLRIDPSNYGKRFRRDAFGRPLDPTPRVVVLHETVYGIGSAINTFMTPHPRDEDQVSYHTLIGLDGRVVEAVDPSKRAFGAGNSAFNGHWVVTNPGGRRLDQQFRPAPQPGDTHRRRKRQHCPQRLHGRPVRRPGGRAGAVDAALRHPVQPHHHPPARGPGRRTDGSPQLRLGRPRGAPRSPRGALLNRQPPGAASQISGLVIGRRLPKSRAWSSGSCM